MILQYFNQFDDQPIFAKVQYDRVHVGSADTNDVVLKNPFVDHESVILRRTDNSWLVQVLGKNGCEIDGQRYHRGATVPWDGVKQLAVFPYILQLRSDAVDSTQATGRLFAEIHELIRTLHLDLLQQMHDNRSGDDIPEDIESLLEIERSIESSAKHHGLMARENSVLASELAGCCVRDELLKLLLHDCGEPGEAVWHQGVLWGQLATTQAVHEDELKRWTVACAQHLFSTLASDTTTAKVAIIDAHFWEVWDQIKSELIHTFAVYLALRYLKKSIKDILFGFGPLEDLLRIPTISEIMVNSSQEIFIERSGLLQNSGRQFVSDEVTTTVIERIVGLVGRRIDTAQPMVDARLPDGSRVNAVIPPLAIKGPCLTIRKFSKQNFTMQKLIEIGTLSPQAAAFLQGSVRAKKNILISGGTGTGKTTLLNCLGQSIPPSERIICIEDTHELQFDHPHVLFFECRDGNSEGKGKVTIRDLVRNALRQRPDRMVVGECRGAEAIDMLQAMNTGHSGSLTTIHANTPEDALRRLEVLVRDAGLPPDAVRQQIVSAMDVVVQITRMPTGERVISAVSEVLTYNEQLQRIQLRPILSARWDAVRQKLGLVPTGCIPTFAHELVRDGHIQLDLFLRGIDAPANLEGIPCTAH